MEKATQLLKIKKSNGSGRFSMKWINRKEGDSLDSAGLNQQFHLMMKNLREDKLDL